MTDPIREDVKYIAELFKALDYDPRLAIADSEFSREFNIYAFSIAPLVTDPANYWIAWGGYFDNPTSFGAAILMNSFLVEVFTPGTLKLTNNSFYVDTTNFIIYMNIAFKPWQYFKAFATLSDNTESTFSTAPKNIENPSDIIYGNISAQPRMEVPTLNNKLNDIVSGINVYNSFSIVIDNADGRYDGFDVLNYFNTPLQISKTSTNAQTIEDFERIRFGFVYDIKVSFNTMTIEAVDTFFLMDRDYNRKFTLADYPNLPDGNINKDIPTGWGPLNKVPAFEVDKDTADPPLWADYIFLDPEYITGVTAVYADSGQSLTFAFDSVSGVVQVTSLDDDGEVIEAESADVTGFLDNSIGQIVIKALADNENIPFEAGIWDIAETTEYLALAADVGFYFPGGTTKELITAVLKNDLAFLIQKNTGVLALRQWGQTYETHVIPEWTSTQAPLKNFKDASKFYCSSVTVQSNLNQTAGNYETTYLDNSREQDIFQAFKRSYNAVFETALLSVQDTADFASRLLDRFGKVRETLGVGVGVDTFEIDLLDTVQYEAVINDRDFSDYSIWISKEADPGQDILTLEGLERLDNLTFDGDFASLDSDFWGVSK